MTWISSTFEPHWREFGLQSVEHATACLSEADGDARHVNVQKIVDVVCDVSAKPRHRTREIERRASSGAMSSHASFLSSQEVDSVVSATAGVFSTQAAKRDQKPTDKTG